MSVGCLGEILQRGIFTDKSLVHAQLESVIQGGVPNPHAGLRVRTCSSYDLCHSG